MALKTNEMTREQVMAAVRAIPAENHYVWDGIDEDDRPLTKEEMQAGIAAARKRKEQQLSSVLSANNNADGMPQRGI